MVADGSTRSEVSPQCCKTTEATTTAFQTVQIKWAVQSLLSRNCFLPTCLWQAGDMTVFNLHTGMEGGAESSTKKGGRRKELGPLLGKVWGEGGWATGLENSQTFLSSSNNAKLVLRLEHVQGFTRFPLAPLRVCASVYKCWHFYNYSISWNHRCRFIFTAEPVASPKCVNCAPKDSAPTGKRIQWQKSPLASQPQSLGSLTCFWVGQIHCHFSRSVLIWAECQLQFEAAFRAGMHEEIRQWRMLTAHTNIST